MAFWKGKKVLVTGGAGFIGSHLARRLVEMGAIVRIVDSLYTGDLRRIDGIKNKAEFFQEDLRIYDTCEKLVNGQEYVFHLAANMGGIGYISFIGADIMSDNLRMNINMLEASKVEGVERVFYSSSACVYPKEKQMLPVVTPLKEIDANPANPDSYYGWEKLATEKLCEAYSRDWGLQTRVLRYHNVYGPMASYSEERGKVICSLIRKAILYPKERFVVWGDGRQTRSFLYISDAVEGTIRLMESDYSKPINVGSDRLVSVNELAKKIIDLSNKDIEIEYDLTKPQGVRGRNADITLAKKVLNWEPKVSLEEGLLKTYNWLENELKKTTHNLCFQ